MAAYMSVCDVVIDMHIVDAAALMLASQIAHGTASSWPARPQSPELPAGMPLSVQDSWVQDSKQGPHL